MRHIVKYPGYLYANKQRVDAVHADREQRILQLSCFKLISDVLRLDNTDLVGIAKCF